MAWFCRWQVYSESSTGLFVLGKRHQKGREGRGRKKQGEGNKRAGKDLHHNCCLLWKFSANDGFFGIQIVHNSISAVQDSAPGPRWGSLRRSQSPYPLVSYGEVCPSPFPTSWTPSTSWCRRLWRRGSVPAEVSQLLNHECAPDFNRKIRIKSGRLCFCILKNTKNAIAITLYVAYLHPRSVTDENNYTLMWWVTITFAHILT